MAAAPTPEHAMESALPTDAAPPGVLQPPAAQAAEPQLLQALIGPSLYLGGQFSTTSNLLDLCLRHYTFMSQRSTNSKQLQPKTY